MNEGTLITLWLLFMMGTIFQTVILILRETPSRKVRCLEYLWLWSQWAAVFLIGGLCL